MIAANRDPKNKTDKPKSPKNIEASTDTNEHNTDNIEVVSVEVVNVANDDSIASADENVPDNSQPYLNSHV